MVSLYDTMEKPDAVELEALQDLVRSRQASCVTKRRLERRRAVVDDVGIEGQPHEERHEERLWQWRYLDFASTSPETVNGQRRGA